MRAKRTGNFMRERRSSMVAAPAEKVCSAPSKSTGCSAYSPARAAMTSDNVTRPAE
jgi:hypothetical protein